MAPRKTKAQLELEATLAAQSKQMQTLLDAFQKSESEKALLTQLVTARQPATASSSQASGLMVGVRNVSNYTLSLVDSPLPNEQDICLHAEDRVLFNPNSVALVSWAWWQRLRKGRLFGLGMIIRDDSMLDPDAVHAPADKPSEVHQDHAKNVVLDPQVFIENQPELELRARIQAMTSEESLRRLLAQVDARVGTEQAKYPDSDEKRAEKAVMGLPSIYQLAENLLLARMNDLDPKDEF